MTRTTPSPEAEARRLAAVREANAKREVTDEQRRKMSAGLRAAWARRRAAGTAKIPQTEEMKAKRAAQLQAVLQDPETEAKRKARSKARLAEVRKTPEFIAALSKGVQRAYATNAEWREHVLSTLDRINSDPEIKAKGEAKRIETIRTPEFRAQLAELAKRPAVKAAREAAKIKAQDQKRGFKVPYHLRAKYRDLTQKRKVPVREAGIIMGLISP